MAGGGDAGETPFDREERAIRDAKTYATGATIPRDQRAVIGETGCTLTDLHATCQCGRDLHITVTVDPERVQALVERVTRDAIIRRARR